MTKQNLAATILALKGYMQKSVKDDPIFEDYTHSYKTHFSRKRAGYLHTKQFKAWAKEAKRMLS
jgi:hypothetical protein